MNQTPTETPPCFRYAGRIRFEAGPDLRSTEAFRLLRKGVVTTDEDAFEWMLPPARALGGRLPVGFIQTEAGRQELAGVILGIGHGNFM